MFKILALLALVATVSCVQESSSQGESSAAPEPYAYAYQAGSHQASEQRAPDGTVTGFYTLSDADGRERRVEYIADASGFRAKVATNELGTKSENSADVEVSASPPTEAQLVYQAPVQQVQYKQQQVAYQQVPQTQTSVRYVQQPAGYQGVSYGYYPGYQSSEYGYKNVANQGAVYGLQGGSYNYHLPAQYYSNVQGVRYTGVPQPATYTVGGSRLVSQSVRSLPVQQAYTYTSGSYPVGGAYTYSTGSSPVSSGVTRTVSTSSSSNTGSGNLLILKKK